MDITTVQFHSTKSEFRFCVGSNPARDVSEICDGEDLWQWSWLQIRLKAFCQSTIPQKNNSSQFIHLWGNSYTMFISSNHASFHLWWKKNLLKHQKVSKYYESGCSYIANQLLITTFRIKSLSKLDDWMRILYRFGYMSLWLLFYFRYMADGF